MSLSRVVDDLRQFYETRQGRVVRRLLRPHLAQFASELDDGCLAIIGYGQPWLSQFVNPRRSVISLAPDAVGAVADHREPARWHTSLVESDRLPLSDRSLDAAILIHALDSVPHEDEKRLLREVWRALAINGRLLVIVPNRTGLWSLTATTPWGRARAYTYDQISRRLTDGLFTVDQRHSAIFMPPSRSRIVNLSGPMLERMGQKLIDALGGVWIVEAHKQLHAAKALLADKAESTVTKLVVGTSRSAVMDYERQDNVGLTLRDPD